ncbi:MULTISPECIES: hypothetical protein [Rhizobium/Agrobacterium group]|uniref:Uncharacterized protein n=1 Tax=Agrobacterium vitis TaxID=373 RepID=A0ABD6HFF8_AGRVI|nr:MULTISPECIES: hypothetical protein [Rhizobium/Agrobacterium group]MUO29576.1 hypothetical protein [Agrobacterium vitis]MUO44129.1 hypothetical protein [Agrobacterium vitis]MUP13143.1 hypothetical protein [Agrobacterium vitis]
MTVPTPGEKVKAYSSDEGTVIVVTLQVDEPLPSDVSCNASKTSGFEKRIPSCVADVTGRTFIPAHDANETDKITSNNDDFRRDIDRKAPILFS